MMPTAMRPDRTAFETQLTAVPEAVPLALALLDVDEFKELNDEQGREAGDEVLRTIERTLATNLPRSAIVGRVGGDEYAVALQRTSPESALILLEEMRAHMSVRDAVSISVGIAARPQHATGAADLVRAAGEALFRAKREGRGRVAIYVEDRMTLKSNYYPKAALERLSKLSGATGRTEASLLREALDDLLASRSDEL
jgi:diguanylate cyclase (GGDEF)-like protein